MYRVLMKDECMIDCLRVVITRNSFAYILLLIEARVSVCDFRSSHVWVVFHKVTVW